MNLSTILGQKVEQTQAFLEDGTRVPLTRVFVGDNMVSQIKTVEKEGYNSVQVAFGKRNKISKPLSGHLKKAGIKNNTRFLREIRVDDTTGIENGVLIAPEEVLSAGDRVDVVGTSKGKGFAGGVKRWGFAGGPKTHGQSDRHRAPGSIGQSTTPGRVYKGKKMAGRMGQDRVTIKNLEIIEVKDGEILIKGLVPGPMGGVIMITKTGENKKFKPLYSISEEVEEAPVAAKEELVEEAVAGENPTTEEISEETSPEETYEAKEEVSENSDTKEDEVAPSEEVNEEKKDDEKSEEKVEENK